MALPAHSPRLTYPVRESTSPVKEGSSEHCVPGYLFDSVHSHRSVLKKAVRYRGEPRNIQAPQTRAAGSVLVAGLLRAPPKDLLMGLSIYSSSLPLLPHPLGFPVEQVANTPVDLPSVTTFTQICHRSHTALRYCLQCSYILKPNPV